MPQDREPLLRFGDFTIDPSARALHKLGSRLKLHRQSFEVLLLLISHPGEVVTREELQTKLWPKDTFVDFENSLNAAVKKLRQTIGDSATEPRFIETVPRIGYRFIALVETAEPHQPKEPPALPLEHVSSAAIAHPQLQHWWLFALAAFLLLVVFAIRDRWKSPSVSPALAAAPRVIAVLPFSNDGAGPELDYLRYAIATDLVTDLSHVRSLTVRSFASTSPYASHPSDPATAGKELHVPYVVVGGYSLGDKYLHVSVKLIDVSRNQPIWHDEIRIAPPQLLVLNHELAARSTQSMLPTLKIPQSSLGEIPRPTSERAFDLYLRSLADTHNYPGSNSAAIKNLEESTALDSRYAPAWHELCWRYFVEYAFGDKNEAWLAKFEDAYKREVALDPIDAFDGPIQVDARQGRLEVAYDKAVDLLLRRPDSASAHFSMGVVLWFAGLLGEAENQCDAALAIDPGDPRFSICATPLMSQGKYDIAEQYILLDLNPIHTAWLRTEIDLRRGDNTGALAEAHIASQAGLHFDDLIRLYLDHDPQSDFNAVIVRIEQREADPKTEEDQPTLYDYASILSFAGQSDAAVDMLRRVIQRNYCSYPAIDNDPLFNSIRQRPEFVALRQAAIQCQQDFLTHRQQFDSASGSSGSKR